MKRDFDAHALALPFLAFYTLRIDYNYNNYYYYTYVLHFIHSLGK